MDGTGNGLGPPGHQTPHPPPRLRGGHLALNFPVLRNLLDEELELQPEGKVDGPGPPTGSLRVDVLFFQNTKPFKGARQCVPRGGPSPSFLPVWWPRGPQDRTRPPPKPSATAKGGGQGWPAQAVPLLPSKAKPVRVVSWDGDPSNRERREGNLQEPRPARRTSQRPGPGRQGLSEG